jgi:hypothetical protein
MRGLVVAGPRPPKGVASSKNSDTEDVSRFGVESFARLASGLGQRQLPHRNPDLGVMSIDREHRCPAVRGAEIERQGSTLSGHSAQRMKSILFRRRV